VGVRGSGCSSDGGCVGCLAWAGQVEGEKEADEAGGRERERKRERVKEKEPKSEWKDSQVARRGGRGEGW